MNLVRITLNYAISRSSPDWSHRLVESSRQFVVGPADSFAETFRWHGFWHADGGWTAWFGAETECERLSSLVDLVRFELTTSSMPFKKGMSITCRQLGAKQKA